MKPAAHVGDPLPGGGGEADIPPECCCDAPYPNPCTEGSLYVQVWPCVEGVKGDCAWFDLSSLTFAANSSAATAKKPCGGGVENPVAAAVQAGWTPANVLKLVAALTK